VIVRIIATCALACLVHGTALAETQRWSVEKVNAWYARQRWLVGANYVPAYAVNQLEMWQADTFNPARIDEELVDQIKAAAAAAQAELD